MDALASMRMDPILTFERVTRLSFFPRVQQTQHKTGPSIHRKKHPDFSSSSPNLERNSPCCSSSSSSIATMPKKMGVNTKAEAARARRSATEDERKASETRAKEEAYWREAEGSKSRAAKKREEEAKKQAEAAARRAENKKLAELEQQKIEKEIRKPNPKASRVSIPVPKVTEAELIKRREEEQQRLQREAEAAKKKQARMADEEEYERMVLVSNTNRDDSIIEAHSLDDAIASMAVAESSSLPADRHPEKRLKASFKAFEEAELPILKAEKPGLTLHQYKDMIWKMWKKSPDNPLNQSAE
ncbi:hypothetical protein LUZ60_014511 [Juncus effusus]|nr:hypothetical protein LUZ60_014511 [Juncus effusus]